MKESFVCVELDITAGHRQLVHPPPDLTNPSVCLMAVCTGLATGVEMGPSYQLSCSDHSDSTELGKCWFIIRRSGS